MSGYYESEPRHKHHHGNAEGPPPPPKPTFGPDIGPEDFVSDFDEVPERFRGERPHAHAAGGPEVYGRNHPSAAENAYSTTASTTGHHHHHHEDASNGPTDTYGQGRYATPDSNYYDPATSQYSQPRPQEPYYTPPSQPPPGHSGYYENRNEYQVPQDLRPGYESDNFRPDNGEASSYYNPPPHENYERPQEHSHLPQIAAQYHQETDPALFAAATQQFHRTNAHPSRPNSVPVDEQAAYAAHEQAYGRHSGASAMDSEAMGSAAAMQALKMSAAQAQATSPSAEPASGEHEHKHTSQAPANTEANNSPPSNPQDKLIALAMAQAAKLFDKQSGGSPTGGSAASSAKTQAMHSAANIAMRMANQYRTTGKASFESGEMQGLIGAAMALL